MALECARMAAFGDLRTLRWHCPSDRKWVALTFYAKGLGRIVRPKWASARAFNRADIEIIGVDRCDYEKIDHPALGLAVTIW